MYSQISAIHTFITSTQNLAEFWKMLFNPTYTNAVPLGQHTIQSSAVWQIIQWIRINARLLLIYYNLTLLFGNLLEAISWVAIVNLSLPPVWFLSSWAKGPRGGCLARLRSTRMQRDLSPFAVDSAILTWSSSGSAHVFLSGVCFVTKSHVTKLSRSWHVQKLTKFFAHLQQRRRRPFWARHLGDFEVLTTRSAVSF